MRQPFLCEKNGSSRKIGELKFKDKYGQYPIFNSANTMTSPYNHITKKDVCVRFL